MYEKQFQSHITADYSELEKILDENQNCHIYLGHQFNWEWANAHVASAFKNKNIPDYIFSGYMVPWYPR